MVYNGCNYLSMLGLKLNHVSKRGHRFACIETRLLNHKVFVVYVLWSNYVTKAVIWLGSFPVK